MLDFFKSEVTINWLNLLWTVGGSAAIIVLRRVWKWASLFFGSYPAVVAAVLGDKTKNIPGIREIAERSEKMALSSEEVSKNALSTCDAMNSAISAQRTEMQGFREELAVSIAMKGELQASVNAQNDKINLITKELTHNGGSSVKDMVRDVSRSASHLLGVFRASADMTDDVAHFSTNPDGTYTWVSKTFYQWTLSSPEEVLGNGWFNSVHKEDRETVRMEWNTSIADSRDFYMEYRMIDSEREHFWVRTQTRKIPGPNNQLLGWYGSVLRLDDEDVTKILGARNK